MRLSTNKNKEEEDIMQTLQEFVAFTKGWEYIIAIVFLALFIGFWRMFTTEPLKKESVRVEEKAVARVRERRPSTVPGSVLATQPVLQNSYCWEVKHCTEENKAACPAHTNPNIPCWQAKAVANVGARVNNDCLGCQVYSTGLGAVSM